MGRGLPVGLQTESSLWEHFGAEFVSLGNYGAHESRRALFDDVPPLSTGRPCRRALEYIGAMLAAKPAYHSDPHGVPRLLQLGGHEFWYMPTGDGIQVYRIEDSSDKILEVSKSGIKQPAFGPQACDWYRSSAAARLAPMARTGRLPNGVGPTRPMRGASRGDDVKWFKKPGQGRHAVFGVDVDLQGNVMVCRTEHAREFGPCRWLA